MRRASRTKAPVSDWIRTRRRRLSPRQRTGCSRSHISAPRLDGWALVKQLRSRPELALVPVIFLTALGSDEDRIRGFRLGADDYLAKPFRFEERQPSLQRGDRLVVRVADSDGTAALPRRLFDQRQLFGYGRRRLVVVEKHVTGGMRNPIRDGQANPGAGR